jgi:hypothetical protein
LEIYKQIIGTLLVLFVAGRRGEAMEHFMQRKFQGSFYGLPGFAQIGCESRGGRLCG